MEVSIYCTYLRLSFISSFLPPQLRSFPSKQALSSTCYCTSTSLPFLKIEVFGRSSLWPLVSLENRAEPSLEKKVNQNARNRVASPIISLCGIHYTYLVLQLSSRTFSIIGSSKGVLPRLEMWGKYDKISHRCYERRFCSAGLAGGGLDFRDASKAIDCEPKSKFDEVCTDY